VSLSNDVVFSGKWKQNFHPDLTRIKPFFLGIDKSEVEVKMMSLTHRFWCGEIDSLDAKFVELPYEVNSGIKLFFIAYLKKNLMYS